MTIITATELHHHFGKYLETGTGRRGGRHHEKRQDSRPAGAARKTVILLTDTLTGVLRGNYDNKAVTAEKMEQTEYTD